MKQLCLPILLVSLAVAPCTCVAAPHHRARTPRTVPVVMLSDLHFDPYHDPAKVPALRAAPVADWPGILSAPASPKAAEDFAAVQGACRMRGADSSWAVLSASLRAAHAEQPKPLFVTVSGDLLAHEFDCRLRALEPSVTGADIAAFAEKTVAFVAQQLHAAFPGTSVFVALGNNDSGCTDYQDTRGSEFLHRAAESLAEDLADSRDRVTLLSEFSDSGDYDVPLPRPMQHTRLIVLQDIFQSRLYKGCGGKADSGAVTAQIEWLRTRLASAREHKEHAWVMAHIPPGIDVYSSFHKYVLTPEQLCQAPEPRPLLSSEALSNTITEFADVAKLAIFAHTHMDEMKLLHNTTGGVVPVKLVPSVSPLNGNSPAFLVAQADPVTAVLKDYSVFAQAHDSDRWSEEYRYSKLYGMPDYSARSVQTLTSKLAADKTGDSETSRSYQKWFYAGDSGLYGLGLRQIWPAYACAIVEDGGPAFHQCMCPATPAAK